MAPFIVPETRLVVVDHIVETEEMVTDFGFPGACYWISERCVVCDKDEKSQASKPNDRYESEGQVQTSRNRPPPNLATDAMAVARIIVTDFFFCNV